MVGLNSHSALCSPSPVMNAAKMVSGLKKLQWSADVTIVALKSLFVTVSSPK